MDGYSLGRHIERTIVGLVVTVAIVCLSIGACGMYLWSNCHYKLAVVNTTTQP